jgi:WD40 repeat protein
MFRWTALCLVLCAGAFALVAMATGAFNPHALPTGDQIAPTAPAVGDSSEPVQPPPSNGLGRGGALILHDARLVAFEREEVPCQRDGAMLIVGTDDPDATGEVLSNIPVPFLARLIDDPKELSAIPEDQWYVLTPAKGFRFPEALNQARVKEAWPQWKAVPNQKFYVRWQEGDPLIPKKHDVVVFERKVFHKINEGDWVKKDQLVALVDPTVQVNDVASKVQKMENAESEFQSAIATREEAIRRAKASTILHDKGAGFISEDNYQADLLNRDRYIEEAKGKESAKGVANEDLAASLTLLKQHHIQAAISGTVQVIYKHPGESVKNLDPIMQIQNPEKLRVEGLADWQDAQILAKGMPAVIEPTRPYGPARVLSGHQQEVTCVAVSRPGKDGKKLILSGSEDGEVRFWDWTAKEQPQVARLYHGTGVVAVACTGPKAARNLALTGDRDGVGRLIDLDRLLPAPVAGIGPAAKQVQTLPLKLSGSHKGSITCAAFSPDGAYCATGGEDRAIRLWKTDDGKLVHTLFAAHKAAVTSVQFAQEKGKVLQLVSAGGDNTLHVWNLEKVDAPTPTPVLPRRSGDVAQLGVSSDGKYVLFDHGSEIRVLSLTDRQIEGVIQSSSAATNFTTMALFAPDGNTVLTNTASEGRLQLWRTPGRLAADGQGRAVELRQFVGGGGATTCAAFDPDENQPAFVVTGSRDNSVMVWQMPKTDEITAKPRETKLTLVGHSLDNGARQVAVWAEVENPDWNKATGLKPGGSAAMVIPPAASVVEAK